MDILYWVVFGLIVGAIANHIDPRPSQGGIVGAIVLGIVGAVVGGYLGSMFIGVGVTGFNVTSVIVAVLGALVALFVGRQLMKGLK